MRCAVASKTEEMDQHKTQNNVQSSLVQSGFFWRIIKVILCVHEHADPIDA